MKTMYIGAASLLALGIVACGDDSGARYAENEEDQNSAYEENGVNEDDAMSEDQITAEDENASRMTMTQDEQSELPGIENAPPHPAGDETVAGTAASLRAAPTTFAEVETEEDLSIVVEDAFNRADLDQDGQLSREEYRVLTASLAPIAAGDAAVDAQTETAGEGDMETTEAEVGADVFAEAAGTGDAVQKESLREAFLARFETADADDDNRLSASEQDDFIRIALSESASSGEQN